METEELINVGQAVTHGNPRRVRNLKTRKEGTVIGIDGDALTVRLDRTTEVWPARDCEEIYS